MTLHYGTITWTMSFTKKVTRNVTYEVMIKESDKYLNHINIIFIKWCSILFVDQLCHSYNLFLTVKNRCAQNASGLETTFLNKLKGEREQKLKYHIFLHKS